MKKLVLLLMLLDIGSAWAAPQPSATAEFESVEQELKAYYFAAARTNDTEVLAKFIESGFPVNITNGKGYTALMVATYHGNTEAFDYLMSRNANSCAEDSRGNTALMAAIFRGELSLARKLMSADCDQQHLNNAGNSATDFAELFGRKELLESLQK